MITQSITGIAPAANPATMDRVTFSTTAAANVLSIANMTAELNTFATQANTTATDTSADAAAARAAAFAATGVGSWQLPTPFASKVKTQGASRRKSIENSDGLGSSANTFNLPQQQATIPGTRTSAVLFTRTAGTWVSSALVGQYAFSYATGAPATGVWLPISANTTTTVTVDGTLHATGTSLITCPWRPVSNSYAHGQGASAFVGGVFDGESVWLVPLSSSNLIKVNPATGAMTSYAHGQGASAFSGGVFDGQSVWLVPYSSSNLVRCSPPRAGRRGLNVTGASTLGGPVFLGAGTATAAPLTFTSGVDLTAPVAGVMEYDGRVFHFTPVASNRGVATAEHYAVLSANFTGANVNTAQPVFNASAAGTITLPAATSYQFEGLYAISTTGTTSHSLGILFGGTATITSIGYTASVSQNATSLATLTAANDLWSAVATNMTVTPAVASATYNVIYLRGVVRLNAAGTFIPQFQYSAAPGVAPVIALNSFFRMWAIGTNTDATAGNWS